MRKTLVIIPHYNKLLLLKECLNHLDNQNTDNFSVLIVDNGSTDGSSEYIYSLMKNDKKYHSILLSENTGFAYAVNKGLNYAIENHYDYSILLNNDAYVENDFIINIVDKMRTDKKLFAVSPLMLSYHKKDLVDSFGDGYNLLGYAFQGMVGEKENTVKNDYSCFSACGGASIYNNEILKKIGLIDEKFFAYLEDVDISYRARLMGYKIKTCKKAKCYHLGSATSGSKYNDFKVKLSARNNIYLLYKNMPLVQIIINIVPLTLGFVVKYLFFFFNGYGHTYITGIKEGFNTMNNLEKVDYKKVNIFNYINIEIQLIINTFRYIISFIKRRFVK